MQNALSVLQYLLSWLILNLHITENSEWAKFDVEKYHINYEDRKTNKMQQLDVYY